jgi:hypothetical protein
MLRLITYQYRADRELFCLQPVMLPAKFLWSAIYLWLQHVSCLVTKRISSGVPSDFKNLSIISVHKILASSDINHGHKSFISFYFE